MNHPATQSALRSEFNDVMPDDTSYAQAPRNLAPIIIYIIVGALITASALLGH